MDVLLTSPWIPPEWIRLHGLQPRGIWAVDGFTPGGWPQSAGVCSYAEAAVRLAEAGTDATVVFATTCDQLRRGFDTAILHGNGRGFLFNLSATWQSAIADQIFRSELERLGRFLLANGGTMPRMDRLRQELARSNDRRRQLLASAPKSASRPFAEAMARFHWDGEFSPPPAVAQTLQVPLALVGGPFLATHWNLLDAIEATGGRVVLNATETGERSLSPFFELKAGSDPFDSLIQGYLKNIVDVFQRPNTPLYSWLEPRLAARQVRGIVLWHFTGCDLWRAEAQTMREVFRLPVLVLEANAEPGAVTRDLTRIQAFVETLR
jgi:hypothetical protein